MRPCRSLCQHLTGLDWRIQALSFFAATSSILRSGIIIGAAFTAIVTSLVKDLFTPLLGLVARRYRLHAIIFITLKGPHVATLDAGQGRLAR